MDIDLDLSRSTHSEIVQAVTDWVSRFDENSAHLIRTAYWAQQINSGASEAVVLACLLHDIENSFHLGRVPPTPDGKDDYFDEKYLLWHAKRSAKFAHDLVLQKGGSHELANRVADLVENHEVGGGAEADLVRDADSVSFLETHAMLFYEWEPSDKSRERAMGKLKAMFERISDPRAKEFATSFYRKAATQLAELFSE